MRGSESGRGQLRRLAITALLAALASCVGTTATGPEPVAQLQFASASLDLGVDQRASISLHNVGSIAVGPISITVSQLQAGGVSVPGADLDVTPSEVPTLNAGASAIVSVSVGTATALPPGSYSARLEAVVAGRSEASAEIGFLVASDGSDVASLEIIGAPDIVRQGEVVVLQVEARDGAGSALGGVEVTWEVAPPGAGLIAADNRFVGYEPGPVEVTARAGISATSATITVTPRGLPPGSYRVIGRGAQEIRFNSDLWVHGDCAYTGTWGDRLGQLGNTLNAWDVSNPEMPELVDSVAVDARVVNDVKVRADGQLAVISHEFSLDRQNGVTLLDLSDGCRPSVLGRFSAGLESGVHNLWVEGDYVYLVTDNIGSGLRVLDISDPRHVSVVASFADPFSFLHDVYVRDGLAFLSHWDSGLIILDVGNGVAGGTPSSPREVSRIRTGGGQSHNAWYWPERGLVFVGEEDFVTPGIMHVVDVSDIFAPREVATYRVAGDTPHNFWLDEARSILHMAWYTEGIVALDVSGDLLGQLELQGRTVATLRYSGTGACPGGASATCAWAPQLHEGLIYAADMNSGLWVLSPDF